MDHLLLRHNSYVRSHRPLPRAMRQPKQANILRRRLISHGGSSSQLGFFVKTGGELDWRDATAYATSKEGLKVLFSGSEAVIACGIGLLIIAMPIHGYVYRAFGAFLGAIGDNILSG